MIGTQMKKVAGAGTLTTCKNNPGPTTNLNRCTKILASTLLFAACCLAFGAWGFAERAPVRALILAAIALLLLAVREGVVKVDEAWNRHMLAWRDLHSRELDGEQVGRDYVGDGTPRTAGGRTYEPLSWKGMQV